MDDFTRDDIHDFKMMMAATRLKNGLPLNRSLMVEWCNAPTAETEEWYGLPPRERHDEKLTKQVL